MLPDRGGVGKSTDRSSNLKLDSKTKFLTPPPLNPPMPSNALPRKPESSRTYEVRPTSEHPRATSTIRKILFISSQAVALKPWLKLDVVVWLRFGDLYPLMMSP